MPSSQIVFGVILVIVLVAMAAFFIWRQWRTLASIRAPNILPVEERHYLRNQAWLRLACSALMLLLAGLLAAHFVLEEPASQLVATGEANRAKGETRPLDPSEEQFLSFYLTFWGIILLVVLAIICLAGIDFFIIRRFGMQQYRKIQADRRAMIEGELARLRSQRNGHN